jgi:hypothetical protein
MEQRRLRLGDILDDYCPRERRVTNHAVVAMIEEAVKQTRCTTCDAEHPYKGARIPVRRKKETPAALYKEVLAGMPEAEGAGTPLLAVAGPALAAALPLSSLPAIDVALSPEVVALADAAAGPELPEPIEPQHQDAVSAGDRAIESIADPPESDGREDEPIVDGPVHRPLIRATLPRPEGQKDARPVHDFTVRHATGRGNGSGSGNFRGDRMRMRTGSGGNAPGGPNGNRAGSGGSRFHGGPGNRPSNSSRQTSGRGGAPSGFRNGNGGPNGKRGRGSRG